jgi:type I restriction enzyme, S subunit
VAEEIVEPGADIVYGIVQPGPRLASGVPYIRGMDIEEGKIKIDQLLFTSKEIANKYSRASLRGGDVLLGIIRATKVAVVPKSLEGANITQGTARFRPSNIIRTGFLAHWLAGANAQSWLHSKYRGIDMPGLNLRDVRRLPVPLAPLDEQEEVVRCIEVAFAWIDRLNSETTSARRLVDHLDEAILAKAFRGELVPQDPNDEPASVLLEGIKAAPPVGTRKAHGRTAAA